MLITKIKYKSMRQTDVNEIDKTSMKSRKKRKNKYSKKLMRSDKNGPRL